MSIPNENLLEGLEQALTTANLDHLGIVAAICKDLKIAQRIDKRLLPTPTRKVSPGQAVVAMILNGLGYTNRTLYMSHHFFNSKPIERLIDPSLQAQDITDYTLAHTLDDIATYGSSKLFMEVAMEIALEEDLLGLINHVDTTSLSLEGSYQNRQEQEQKEKKEQEKEQEEQEQVISISYGYSKDHRPDLKQVILSLVVNGASGIPIYMEALSGNSSDHTSLHEAINKVESFKKQIEIDQPFKWVADSALYTKDKLLKNNKYTWLTRVPETIKEAREILEKPSKDITWQEQAKGYKTSSYTSQYGGVEQRWMLVYSAQSYEKEKKALEDKLTREKKRLQQVLWHLSNQVFGCQADANKAIQALVSKEKLLEISYQIETIKGYKRAGKPNQGEEQEIKGYKVVGSVGEKKEELAKVVNRKGRFILATNDLDTSSYSEQSILEEYKDQQQVERGFRFLKDPWFMVDSVFLKLPRRIESLMMIMSLTLLVYNVGQYKVRKKLEEKEETLPNQLGKQINNPTLRWLFQLLEGIGIIYLADGLTGRSNKSYITNVNPLRAKIIRLFGEEAIEIYGMEREKKVA